jgi:hypothetical protein
VVMLMEMCIVYIVCYVFSSVLLCCISVSLHDAIWHTSFHLLHSGEVFNSSCHQSSGSN